MSRVDDALRALEGVPRDDRIPCHRGTAPSGAVQAEPILARRSASSGSRISTEKSRPRVAGTFGAGSPNATCAQGHSS